MALSIDIAANTRAAQAQVKDLGNAFDDVSDALDDVARDSDQAAEKVERSFRDMVRSSEKAGDDVGDGMRKGFKRAGEGASEFKDEAKSTAREAAASFDGSAESVADAFQEVTANAFAGFGPAGAAAGIAAAAGLGVVVDTWGKVQEATEQAKEGAYDYAFAVMDSGQTIANTESIKEYTSDLELMKQAQDIASVSGWGLADVVRAMATGDGLPALTQAFEDGAMTTMVTGQRVAELGGALEGTAEGLRTGAVGASIYSEELFRIAQESGTATGEVDDLGNAIVTLPGGKQVVVDAVTQQAFEDIDAVEKRRLGDKSTTVKVKVDSSAWDNWTPAQKRGVIAADKKGLDWQ